MEAFSKSKNWWALYSYLLWLATTVASSAKDLDSNRTDLQLFQMVCLPLSSHKAHKVLAKELTPIRRSQDTNTPIVFVNTRVSWKLNPATCEGAAFNLPATTVDGTRVLSLDLHVTGVNRSKTLSAALLSKVNYTQHSILHDPCDVLIEMKNACSVSESRLQILNFFNRYDYS